jgi:Fe-S oxidoreductase
MTTTYDPGHPMYLDEADVRDELTRVYDVCQECRRCADLCSSFPTLFEMIDHRADRDVGSLTPAQQDRVVEECFQCKRCSFDCPYTPGRDERAVDFPRLALRAAAMRLANGHVPARERRTTRLVGRAGLVGRVATATAPIADRFVDAPPGSVRRTAVSAATGLSPVRLLPSFARQRFSTWFAARPNVTLAEERGERGTVTVFPTCLVEYQAPTVGKDLVRVFERNGVACSLTAAGCCGAPSLHAGDVGRFAALAGRSVAALADEVRSGRDIVVPQPTCSYVLRHDYPDHVGGPDADLVAAHTYDAAEYLMRIHRSGDGALDTDFRGEIPHDIAYHASCHLRAQGIGFPGRDLMRLTGAEVTLVEQCSGSGGGWGLRAGHEEISVPIAADLGTRVDAAGAAAVAGDCHVANTAILERTGTAVVHPMQVMARAYGIPADP